MRYRTVWLATVCCLAVGCTSHRGLERDIARIGTEKLIAAAESVRSVGEGSVGRVALPEEGWPEPIRGLRPQAVRVAKQGVFVRFGVRFAAEEGLFIPFTGVVVSTDNGTDPRFERLPSGLYWYEIKG